MAFSLTHLLSESQVLMWCLFLPPIQPASPQMHLSSQNISQCGTGLRSRASRKKPSSRHFPTRQREGEKRNMFGKDFLLLYWNPFLICSPFFRKIQSFCLFVRSPSSQIRMSPLGWGSIILLFLTQRREQTPPHALCSAVQKENLLLSLARV